MSIKSKKGFTIIEVVLVLAIAGLIFLMVFIALPNLQRSQRDTQRRNDYSALSAGLVQYMTNNNGKMPAACTATSAACKSLATLLNSTGEGPSGNPYTVTVKVATAAGTETVSAVDGVTIIEKAQCGDLTAAASVGGTGGKATYTLKTGERNFIIVGYVENTPGVYCYSSNQ